MSTTATQTGIGSMISAGLRMAIGYGQKLCADAPADTFGHMPPKGMNSALFNMGHLAIYPEKAFAMIGKPELAKPLPEKWEELFKNGAPCVEQDGRYPGKDAIVQRYVERYNALADALESVPDEVFHRPNPMGGRMT